MLPLTGCWDRKELSELGIVTALGIGKDSETGKITLTSAVMRPGSLSKEGGGGSSESPYEIVVTTGNTIFEAIRNTNKEFDRRSFFSHIKVIIVEEGLARDGLSDVIDFVTRSHEIKKFTWLVVAQGEEAKKVLGIKHGIDNVQSTYMEGIINKQNLNPDVTSARIIDFIQKMPDEGISPVTGVFKVEEVEGVPEAGKEPENRKGLALGGTAVFNKDKLVGFLDYDETRGFNYLIGNIKSGAIHIPSLRDKNKNIAIEVGRTKSKIKPLINNGTISFDIEISVEGNVTEVEDTSDVSDPKQFEKVRDAFMQSIKKDVSASITKIQKDLRTDIIGSGSAFERKYPKEWKKIQKQWETLFPNVAFNIKIKANLKHTGLLKKPINSK
jgi:spore germination protein KC